jgi:hypothetical protein
MTRFSIVTVAPKILPGKRFTVEGGLTCKIGKKSRNQYDVNI